MVSRTLTDDQNGPAEYILMGCRIKYVLTISIFLIKLLKIIYKSRRAAFLYSSISTLGNTMLKSRKRSIEERLPCHRLLQFLVLSKHGSEFRRNKCEGTIVDTSKTGIKVLTEFKIHPSDVLLWDDIHKPRAVHIAFVKWSKKETDGYRGGLKLL